MRSVLKAARSKEMQVRTVTSDGRRLTQSRAWAFADSSFREIMLQAITSWRRLARARSKLASVGMGNCRQQSWENIAAGDYHLASIGMGGEYIDMCRHGHLPTVGLGK